MQWKREGSRAHWAIDFEVENMDIQAKLKILADAAKYDASCASSGSKRKNMGGLGDTQGMGICHSYAPDGRCISLLKVLFTNVCLYDCSFCINRVSSDTPRASFTVEEVVWLTQEFYRRNYIEGLFLSSGIIRSADYTMEMLVRVARSLREDHKFGGYIHLKAIPGASPELLEDAGRLVDRLSANIELPDQGDLDAFAPAKKVRTIEGTMAQVKTSVDAHRPGKGPTRFKPPSFLPAGQSTQLIVGASPSSDAKLLGAADHLYRAHKLRRIYYSAFSPIPDGDPRLPMKPAPMVRENRLYQADWLMRFYGFKVGELTTPDAPNLPSHMDPKLAWALRNRGRFPVDVNRASKWMLLRVPGFGTRSVERILALRRHTRIRLEDLVKMGVSLKRAQYFITTASPNPSIKSLDSSNLENMVAPRKPRQLNLFESRISAVTGAI